MLQILNCYFTLYALRFTLLLPRQFQNLIKHFSKFPGIGSKQATRFAFHLLRQPQGQFQDLINELVNLKKGVRICQNCFFIFDNNTGNSDICHICSDPKRNKNVICVVEKETDILAIEKTGHYNGTYHILGGNIYAINEQPDNFIINNFKNRLEKLKSGNQDHQTIELIMALNPTPDGDATTSFLIRNIADLNIKITRLARGLQRGADLEYADQETLMYAIQNRTNN